jgi:hypothetical protein
LDYETLKQLKESRIAKTKAVAGDVKRFEWDRDKAARIAMQPFYQQPDMKPTFDPRPQELGDPYNKQGPRSGYQNDVADSDWKSAPAESGERKPRFDSMEAKSKKSGYAKAPGRIPDNPAELGRGARTSPSRRGHLIESDD